LKIDRSSEQFQGDQAFRIVSDDAYRVVQRRRDGEWKSEYRFTLQPYNYADFEEMCRYHQTSPDSHFTQKRICSLATSDGRITVSDMLFIVTSNGLREERTLSNSQEYDEILHKQFGIKM